MRFMNRPALAMTLMLACAACSDGSNSNAPASPKAFIRFINAMPDTLGVDFHAVDIVENSPYIATLFRDIKQAGYTPVAAGTRHFREFLSNPDTATARTVSTVLVDTIMRLEAGTHYSIMHVGFARAGQTPSAKFIIRPDTIPTPPTGQLVVRVVNLAPGLGNVDVYASASGTGPLPQAPVFANATYLVPTTYVSLPIGATLALRATIAGAGNLAPPIASVTVPAGDSGSTSLDPIPGSAIPGSVFTVYVFARSTPDSRAPRQFLTPALVVVPDAQLHGRLKP